MLQISADDAPEGQEFDQWTGNAVSVNALDNVASASATVTMPASDVILTATYTDIIAPTYALTINSGTGDGNYEAGSTQQISANTASAGQEFDQWAGNAVLLNALDSAVSANATVTMPASDVTLTATYTDIIAPTYALNINSGTGDGNYAAGSTQQISANTAPAGQEFDQWTGNAVSLNALDSAVSANATVTMPASDVTLTAEYKNIAVSTYTLTVTDGTGGGTYEASDLATISADAAPTGQVFDKWSSGFVALDGITSSPPHV